jgi:uncharacterized protein YecE (DUF72 family)
VAHALGTCRLTFGIAGWSYPDWEGIVYDRRDPDKLRTVARCVDLIEINASFYDFLSPLTMERWLARTADLPLRFSAKANRLFTHEESRACDPAEMRAFARGVEPLRREGRLAALLFQFPFTFRDGAAARERLSTLARGFAAFPLVAEVRHRSWQTPEVLEFLASQGFSAANLDLPVSGTTFQERLAATGEPGYLRLHGRNAREWFTAGAGRNARYDYLYDDEELEEIAERIEELAQRFRELIIVTNNHYRGQALANLSELAVRTGGAGRPLPAGLIRTYPRLAAIAEPLTTEVPPAPELPMAPPTGATSGGTAEGLSRRPTAARSGDRSPRRTTAGAKSPNEQGELFET